MKASLVRMNQLGLAPRSLRLIEDFCGIEVVTYHIKEVIIRLPDNGHPHLQVCLVPEQAEEFGVHLPLMRQSHIDWLFLLLSAQVIVPLKT